MRVLSIALAITCAACSTADDPDVAPSSIAGMWSQTAGVTPGGVQLGLNLTESGIAVSGTATGATIPISGVQSYQVSGQYRRPDISLTIVPIADGHPVAGVSYTFTGHAVDTNTIVLNNLTLNRPQVVPLR